MFRFLECSNVSNLTASDRKYRGAIDILAGHRKGEKMQIRNMIGESFAMRISELEENNL